MGIVNAVLVEWDKGMVWVTHPSSIADWGRIEDHLSVRVSSEEAAIRIGQEWLAERAVPRMATVADVVAGTATGDIGDTLTVGSQTGVAIVGLTYRLEANGDLSETPEVSTEDEQDEELSERKLDRLIVENGGRSPASSKPLDFGTMIRPGKVSTRNVKEWSWRAKEDLDATDEDWQPFVAPRPCRLYEWRVDCDNDEATGTSIFEFRVNGVHDGLLNIVLGPSATSAVVNLWGYEVLLLNDVLRPRCSQNGGHTNGTVQFRGADVV